MALKVAASWAISSLPWTGTRRVRSELLIDAATSRTLRTGARICPAMSQAMNTEVPNPPRASREIIRISALTAARPSAVKNATARWAGGWSGAAAKSMRPQRTGPRSGSSNTPETPGEVRISRTRGSSGDMGSGWEPLSADRSIWMSWPSLNPMMDSVGSGICRAR